MRKKSEINIKSIDLYGLLNEIIRNLWMVILGTIGVALVVYSVLSYTNKKEYTTKVTFAVNATANKVNPYLNLQSSLELVGIYKDVLENKILLEKVKEELDDPNLDAIIKANVLSETNLIELSVTCSNPQEAYNVMKAILNRYHEVCDYVFDNATIQTLDYAKVPEKPSNGTMNRAIVSSVCVSFLLFLSVIILIYVFKDTVMTEAAVKDKIDTKLLGSIIFERKNKTVKTRMKNATKGISIANPTVSSLYTQNIQEIAMKLRYAMKKEQLKTLLVTSASENEGKTTVAMNVAMELANDGYKVLLIDGDYRKPALYKALEVNRKNIIDYTDFETAEDIVKCIKYNPNNRNLKLLLNMRETDDYFNNKFKKIFEEMTGMLKNQVEYIIVDMPPMGAVVDAEEMADLVDASLLVVKSDKMLACQINDCVDRLEQRKAKLIGCVLNGVNKSTYKKNNSYYVGKPRDINKLSKRSMTKIPREFVGGERKL